MTSPLTSGTCFHVSNSISIPQDQFKTVIKNKAFESYNAFYNNNNYIYPDEYKQKTEWSITEPDLPEWYNTVFDQEIVNEIFNEYELFYNPYLSVEIEQNIEDEYQRQNEINDSDSSDSEGEWYSVD